jgi:hypothetical protein
VVHARGAGAHGDRTGLHPRNRPASELEPRGEGPTSAGLRAGHPHGRDRTASSLERSVRWIETMSSSIPPGR